MEHALQRAAVCRCASELSRAIWYYRAWKALQEVDREDTANFIRLAVIAMGDQMIAHAVKVLRVNKNGKGEKAGFWSLCQCRGDDVEAICATLGTGLDLIRNVGAGLNHVRDKTHFHLDPIGVSDPKSVWKEANITHGQFEAALSTSLAIVTELHRSIIGRTYETWAYDGSDAKVIAEHAEKHKLLYTARVAE